MIGVVVGTSEGKEILSLLNEFTEDIFVSTATKYGGELLENYKYKILNTNPLDKYGFCKIIRDNNINIFIDASHPYAIEVSKNVIEACKCSGIVYFRYERPSIIEEFKNYKNIIKVKDYKELKEKLKNINGTILDTTGSKNIQKIIDMNLNSRIVHRVLPSSLVIKKCIDLGVKIENLIAIKGPISYELNKAFIKEYNAEALIMKDSGTAGGTYEKAKAIIDMNICGLIIERENIEYKNKFTSIKKLINKVKGENNEYFK
ncbi:cobalt-precorrin-6A reductase [Clostridium novyi]|uniref:cobalt-precorrin-6A reductase n=1 Tax=Clostridium novyi TaxID=1542 RepID=UPI0004D3A94D|nr:cobalt-precorrin-6A reductase [Clostridium novyi]KEI12936.1 cobalt-precorrin-6X reductase [Clostridium novyi B str. NCTC 9691]